MPPTVATPLRGGSRIQPCKTTRPSSLQALPTRALFPCERTIFHPNLPKWPASPRRYADDFLPSWSAQYHVRRIPHPLMNTRIGKPPLRKSELFISVVILIVVWITSALCVASLTMELVTGSKAFPIGWVLYAILVPALILIPVQIRRYFRNHS